MSARIRTELRFKRSLCLVLIDVRCLRLPPGVRVPQVEHYSISTVAAGLEDKTSHIDLKACRGFHTQANY
jgi:hypothetical protein